jgi:predicted component of type VI protein secretion system
MQPDDVQDIGELPAYSYQDDGEWKVAPCGEVFLTEAAIDGILERGLIPLVSLKNTNSVRLLRFQSISDAEPALAGQW